MLIEKLNVSEEQIELHFSSKVMSIIDESLDSISKKFIIYRYEYNLDYEEIADLLQISIEDIKILEHNILLQLRHNENLIKSLKNEFVFCSCYYLIV